LVGEGLEPVTLAHDIAAELVENPGWQGLDDIVRGLDLGLVLGAAPYPRDWMLRIAAHGRVVVTNRFMDVDPMAGYAGHIVTSASDVASLVEGLRDGITLASAARDEGRDAHADAFERDWATAFGRVLDFVADQ
jgi:hypothetical protein